MPDGFVLTAGRPHMPVYAQRAVRYKLRAVEPYGAGAIQQGVAAGTIELPRAAVLRGTVTNRLGGAAFAQSSGASRFGVGNSTYCVERPAGASDGSERVGAVTRNDGSIITRPDSSSVNTERHAAPKWIV